MNRWQLRAAWDLIRDIAITGTGLVIIWRQVLYDPLHPSLPLLGDRQQAVSGTISPAAETPAVTFNLYRD